jgi:hypothetical protein
MMSHHVIRHQMKIAILQWMIDLNMVEIQLMVVRETMNVQQVLYDVNY